MAEEKSRHDIKETLEQLNTDLESGLSTKEVNKRLEEYGYNEIEETEETLFQRILKRFWGPIPWMIEAAAILSAVAGKWESFIIILVLLLVNVVVDFAQESKALSALQVLKDKLAKKALVKRDGEYQSLDAKMVVPGDIIKLKIGDIIPADAVAVKGNYVQVDQAALTGESLPVNKEKGEELYGNSIVKMGEMEAVVTATAMNTFFGKSASLVVEAGKERKSHFQKAVIKIGNGLILLTICLAVLLVIVSLFRHDPTLEVLRFILVLVVASIPVALPAVLSVTMAVGAIDLAHRQAIVSRLAAIEELAGVDILCSDKTGTLTQNKMSIADPFLYNNFTEEDLFLYAVLASRKENNDPIEIPIFGRFSAQGQEDKLKAFELENFTPFDPGSKRTEAELMHEGKKWIVTKGAPQVVLKLCENESEKDKINEDVHASAVKGNRTLGVAVKKEADETFSFVGLIPLYDPPREESKATIAEARKLGLKVKMITGDNQAIAREIASLLDIGTNILDTNELRSEGASDEFTILAEIIGGTLYKKLAPAADAAEIQQLKDDLVAEVRQQISEVNLPHGHIRKHESEIIDIIENADGFSQVLPEDKYFIIDKLQKADHIVAMTGDGVNDAPALRKADAGIAVAGATDAARAAADVIFVESGLSVIINAIHEARMVFERMQNYAVFRIAETMRVIFFMALSILVFNFYPVTAVMIIFLALLNDVPIMMIAYDKVKTNPTPVRWKMNDVMIIASVLGIVGVISSFSLYYIVERMGFSMAMIQAFIFLKLVVASNSTIYITRAGERHFWQKPFPARKFFIPAFSATIVGTLVAVYGFLMKPVGWEYAGLIWAYVIIWFLISDFMKVFTYQLLNKRDNNGS